MCSDYLSLFSRLPFACLGPRCFSWYLGLCVVEQNLRIPRLEFSEFVSATACVSFVLCFLHVRCTAHRHQQCVRAKLANRASHFSCNRFFRGVMTLARLRPLTIVGRPFLSVIIISWESISDTFRNVNESLFSGGTASGLGPI